MFDLLPYAGDVGIPFITCIDFAQVMILLHCLFTAGSGAVVQNEKLEIRERLREHAVHGFAKLFRASVVHRHEYENTGHNQSLPVRRYQTGIPHTRKIS